MAGPRHDPTLYRDRDTVPIRRAARLGERQDRPARPGRGSGRCGCRDRLDRFDGVDHAAMRASPSRTWPPSRARRRDARRTRQDAAHPKIHGGLLADLRLEDHERQLAELDITPLRTGRRQPLPLRRDRRLGRRRRRRGRADRHRRTRDGACRCEKTTPTWRSSSRRSRTPGSSQRSPRACTSVSQRRELAARAFAHRRRPTTPRSPPGSPRARCRTTATSRPISRSRPSASPLSATARTRTSAERSTRATGGHGIRSGQAAAWARRCRTTTTSTRMPPCAPRTT